VVAVEETVDQVGVGRGEHLDTSGLSRRFIARRRREGTDVDTARHHARQLTAATRPVPNSILGAVVPTRLRRNLMQRDVIGVPVLSRQNGHGIAAALSLCAAAPTAKAPTPSTSGLRYGGRVRPGVA
jgi:hypothetical protein